MSSISLTPLAAKHIETILHKRGSGIGFKLSVNTTGCSGYSYVMGIAEQVADNDIVISSQGVQVVIPHDSMQYLQGTEIDLQSQGLNRKLVFHNPNAVDACGCGESFNLKKEEE